MMDGRAHYFKTFGEDDAHIQKIRDVEYPQLKDTCYLDHAGTALYPKSLIECFSSDLTSTLYGNPHSAAPSSIKTTRSIEDIRYEALRFFNADPQYFDLVFVANATAGIKLVMDSFRDAETGFWYGYHRESHTSLVGVREAAKLGSRCVESDSEAERWIQAETPGSPRLELFAYPAQSNMNGRRLPLRWCQDIRNRNEECGRNTRYSLLDAAALVSSSPLDLSDAQSAPDFTVLSFYKIFGFPDLGALIVRKASAEILRNRQYFGGGTVDMVVCLQEQWHVSKSTSIHAVLEDGSLPFHSIMALKHAFSIHRELYGSMDDIARRLAVLVETLYHGLAAMKHYNGSPVCKIYQNQDKPSAYGDSNLQGPTIAFNMRNSQGAWISISEVDKLASIKSIHLRTGGLCNPGGIASFLDLSPWQMRENFSGGHRCGGDEDIWAGKPTGVVRVSLGAPSTQRDIDVFLKFVGEFFVEKKAVPSHSIEPEVSVEDISQGNFHVESLTIYPIKSCAGWCIPSDQSWEVRREGLAWDREWCLVHESTGVALTQKRHPKMALIRPSIDLKAGTLGVRFAGSPETPARGKLPVVSVPLSGDPTYLEDFGRDHGQERKSTVFGDQISARAYISTKVNSFFSQALGVPCKLARFPASGGSQSGRHVKAHLQEQKSSSSSSSSHESRLDAGAGPTPPLLLSNESPILIISRSSLNRLNEQIKERGGKAARAEVFRANIVVAQHLSLAGGSEQAYIEDHWRLARIGQQFFEMLGSCRRCQMVCVDQQTGEKNAEPFVTLAKTRRCNGRVWFGQHSCHLPVLSGSSIAGQNPTIRVGDSVESLFPGVEADGIIQQSRELKSSSSNNNNNSNSLLGSSS